MLINPNAQHFTVLTRPGTKTATVFVWDFLHWLIFDSAGKYDDIVLVGTANSYTGAMEIINRELPGYRAVVKYCPRSASWF